jgi:hypothetical protein
MIKARLTQVTGDAEDFTDMIGETGELWTDSKPARFKANGDIIGMLSKRTVIKDGTVKISTTLGNTFTFRVIGV